MSKFPSQMQDKFNLRFPEGMRDAIAERAKANGRSMNSEIIQIIEDSFRAQDYSDDEFDLMYEYVTTEQPCDEEEWRMRDKTLTKLVNEISNRLENETRRLKSLFEIRSPDGTYKPPRSY